MVPEALGERLGNGAALHLRGEGRGTWWGDTRGERHPRGEAAVAWRMEGATVDYERRGGHWPASVAEPVRCVRSLLSPLDAARKGTGPLSREVIVTRLPRVNLRANSLKHNLYH